MPIHLLHKGILLAGCSAWPIIMIGTEASSGSWKPDSGDRMNIRIFSPGWHSARQIGGSNSMVLAISDQDWTVHDSYRQTCTLQIIARRAGDRVIMNEFFRVAIYSQVKSRLSLMGKSACIVSLITFYSFNGSEFYSISFSKDSDSL